MLRWLIEHGKVDVQLETSQLSSYLAGSRTCQLTLNLHIFHYLKNHDSSWMLIDTTSLDVKYKGPQEGSTEKSREIMKRVYREAIEEIPDNMPMLRRKLVQIDIYVDTGHADNRVTRKSKSGMMIFRNMALVS